MIPDTKVGSVPIKTAIGIWGVAAVFQVLIATGLLVIAYGDTFGLNQIAANGEKILNQLTQLGQRDSSQPIVSHLRPVLAASNQAFHQLGNLLSWVGVALLISVLAQFAALVILRRRSKPNSTSEECIGSGVE